MAAAQRTTRAALIAQTVASLAWKVCTLPHISPEAQNAAMALHLRAAMRAIEVHDGRRFHAFSIAWAKRRVLEAANPLTDPSLLRLREKERECGCSIAELAKVAATWPDG